MSWFDTWLNKQENFIPSLNSARMMTGFFPCMIFDKELGAYSTPLIFIFYYPDFVSVMCVLLKVTGLTPNETTTAACLD